MPNSFSFRKFPLRKTNNNQLKKNKGAATMTITATEKMKEGNSISDAEAMGIFLLGTFVMLIMSFVLRNYIGKPLGAWFLNTDNNVSDIFFAGARSSTRLVTYVYVIALIIFTLFFFFLFSFYFCFNFIYTCKRCSQRSRNLFKLSANASHTLRFLSMGSILCR